MKTSKFLFLIIVLLISYQSYSATHVITQSGFSFSPSTLTVDVGDIIRWEWTAGTHTTTSRVIPNGAATWDSPLTSTATSFEYTVTVAGVYNYVCKPHEGMGMKGSFTAVNPTSLDENKSSDFTIYPNPAINFINIASGVEGEIILSDILGKKLFNFQTNELKVIADSYRIDLSGLKNGIYIVTLMPLDGNKPKSLKFIKK